MSHPPRSGYDSMPLRTGRVALFTHVPPDLKDRLIAAAEHEDIPMRVVIEEALCRYLKEEGF